METQPEAASNPTVSTLPPQTAEETAAHDEIMRQIFGDVGELQSGDLI